MLSSPASLSAIDDNLQDNNYSVNSTFSFQPDLLYIKEQIEGIPIYSTLLSSIKNNSPLLPDHLLETLHILEDSLAEHKSTSMALDQRLKDLKEVNSPEQISSNFSLLDIGMHKIQSSLEDFAAPPSSTITNASYLSDLKLRQRRLKDLKIIFNILLDLQLKGIEADFIKNISLSLSKEDFSLKLKKLLIVTMPNSSISLPSTLKEINEILKKVETSFENDLVGSITTSLLKLPFTFKEDCEDEDKNEIDLSIIMDINSSSNSLLILAKKDRMINCFIENHIFFKEGPPQREYIISSHHPSSKSDIQITQDSPLEIEPVLQNLFDQLMETLKADNFYLKMIFGENDDDASGASQLIIANLLERIVKEAVYIYCDEIFLQAKSFSGSLAAWRSLGRCWIGVMMFIDSLKTFIPLLLCDKMKDDFISLITINHLSNHFKDEGENMKILLSSMLKIILKGGEGEMDSIKTLKRLKIHSENGEIIPLTNILKRSLTLNPLFFSFYLKIIGEAIERLFFFNPNSESSHKIEVFFLDSLANLKGNWFKKRFSLLEENLQQQQFSSQSQFDCKPSLNIYRQLFDFISNSNKILSLFNSFTHNLVGPLILKSNCDTSYNSQCYRNIILAKNDLFLFVEGFINRFLSDSISSSLMIIEKNLLSTQKRSDFRPNELPNSLGGGGTPTARKIISFITEFISIIKGSSNLSHLVDDFLYSIFILLIDHIRNFTINDIGAIVLQDDFKFYANLLSSLGSFKGGEIEFLLEIPLLYIVKPEGIVKMIDETRFLSLQSLDILDMLFISKREDYLRKNVKKIIGVI